MNLPARLTQRILAGIAVSGLAIAGVSVVALAARPASSSTPERQSVQLVQPAADAPEPTTTTVADPAAAVRAEHAATRAEGAATRAETAAAHVDQVAGAPTTTTTGDAATVVAAPSTTTTAARPQFVQIPEPSTTTTTTVPKAWVVIARFPVRNGYDQSMPVPVEAGVDLSGAPVRVRGLPGDHRPMSINFGSKVWLDGDESQSSGDSQLSWAVGHHTVSAGSWDPGINNNPPGWRAPYSGDNDTTEITIEEYR